MEREGLGDSKGLEGERGCCFTWGSQRSFCEEVTFELRPEDNKSEPCGYLGEEHSWQHSLKQVRSQKHGSQIMETRGLF